MQFRLRIGSVFVLGMLLAWASSAPRADAQGSIEQQLRKELDAVKETLRQVEQQLNQQDELLRKLSGEKPAGPPAAPQPAAPSGTTPTVPAPAGTAVNEQELKLKILDEVQRMIQPQLATANRTFASQFNPAISLAIDTVFFYNATDNTATFEFRSAELGLSASIDPFARGYAFINGTPEGVEVEEAAIVTTALPYSLTVKGGRFFADFGRLSKFHGHDLPFVNRPIVLDEYVGGESQADGVEVSWLVPLPFYLNLTGGAYNKMGGENDRVDNLVPRGWSEFTYLGRAATFISLTDEHSIDLGISDAYTPNVMVNDGTSRNLVDLDVTYRYTPLASAGYRGLIWGSEFLWNREARVANDFAYRDAFGMYSYLEARWTRRFYAGFLFQYVQDIDRLLDPTDSYSPYVTWWPSDFQRLRFQYSRVNGPGEAENLFFLQWTAVLGSHAHTFRDR